MQKNLFSWLFVDIDAPPFIFGVYTKKLIAPVVFPIGHRRRNERCLWGSCIGLVQRTTLCLSPDRDVR